MVAAAMLLGYLKIWRMPNGGSVTLVMLPIFIFSWRWGAKSGLLAGLALGILQLIFDIAYAMGWQAIFGDYVIAYTVLGLSGFFRKMKGGLYIGMIVGSFARFLCHFWTGVTIWAEYMPDVFFGIKMTSAYLYSALYNGSYVFLSMLCCIIVGALLKKPLENRRIKAE